MPTRDPTEALPLERALERTCERAFPRPADPAAACATRAVGLEQERFVVHIDGDGSPVGRMPLGGPDGVAQAVVDRALAGDRLLVAPDPELYPPVVELVGGGTLTFEPGGQIEHSTRVHASASGALDDLHAVVRKLEEVFHGRRVRLVAVGIDPWHGPADVPQQLDAPRYRAMDAYFASRGPSGAHMMRLSCSLQVNLDLGGSRVREERWELANLLGPALTATFTTSPGLLHGVDWASRRARVWQTIDPTRAALPRGFIDHPEWSPERQYAEAVLDADVMLVRAGDGEFATGRPGWRFRDWITGGHPEHGFPTDADLDYHLTTVFFDVRARGFFELRAVDALPYCFRPAPVAMLAGLLYDDAARGAALERLAPRRASVCDLYARAARHGLADREVAADARALFTWGLEGAARLGDGFIAPHHLRAAEAFGERFVARGRAPGDELRAALAVGAAEGLAWAMSSGCGGRDEVQALDAVAAGSEGPCA